MYKFGKADKVVKAPCGYKVRIFNDGYIYMTNFDGKEDTFNECLFDTEQEAIDAMNKYNEMSWQ